MLFKKIFAGALLLLVITTACRQPQNPGGKIWFYTHSTGMNEKSNTALTPASFLNLENDGSYTADLVHFDYGKWVYNNNQIILTDYKQTRSVVLVNYLTATEMQVGEPTGPFNNFESQPLNFSSKAENPFSKENNLWRLKPGAKETTGQLADRLRNHFKFWELYFSWALNSSIEYIDVRSTPTPIKIYGNGFTLKPFYQLPASWKACFFDEDDCRAANEKIKYIFDNGNIAWPHTDNKYKMFISAFQQLEQKIQ